MRAEFFHIALDPRLEMPHSCITFNYIKDYTENSSGKFWQSSPLTFGQQYIHIEKMPSGISAVSPHQGSTDYKSLSELLFVEGDSAGDQDV